MDRPIRLSEEQKKALSNLEPALRKCVASADLEKAKAITIKIQKLLRPTGHETRLLQAKNWLYETALEAGELSYAKLGLEETIQKSSSATRLHLEAVTLLAICYLRERDIEKAKELVIDAVEKIYNIRTFWRREQFYRRLITRLEQESILISLVDGVKRKLTVDEVNAETEKLVESKSESQILLEMGKAVPRQLIDILLEIKKEYFRDIREEYLRDIREKNLRDIREKNLRDIREAHQLRRLTHDDMHLIPSRPPPLPLPPPVNADDKQELGNRAKSALKRVAWRSLCSPDSEIYKAWSQGLSITYDKKYITAAIVAAFNSWSIGITMLAASFAALTIKFGLEVICETFAPESIMIERSDNR